MHWVGPSTGGAAITTWLLLFPIAAGLRRAGVIDRPNARSSHSVSTVRGAGVGIVVVVACVLASMVAIGGDRNQPMLVGNSVSVSRGSGTTLAVLLASFVALAVVSFIDDMRGLPAKLRFGVHAAVSVAAVWAVFLNNEQPITSIAATLGVSAVAVLWIAGYTNAFNFMDGINGLAGVQALVTAVGAVAIALTLGVPVAHPSVTLGLITGGAALGFLPHNFPRARVFMGDVGSAPLGFLLSTLAVWIAAKTHWWVLVWIALLHANFVLDTGITVVRRAARRERLSQAHREHFYQRLVRAGQTHTRVTLTEGALQLVVAVMVVLAMNASVVVRVGVGAAVVSIWCGYFAYAERVFRQSPAGRSAQTLYRAEGDISQS